MSKKKRLHEFLLEVHKFTWNEYIDWLSNYCDSVILKYKIDTGREMYGGKLVISEETSGGQKMIYAVYEIFFQDESSKWIMLKDRITKTESDFVMSDLETVNRLRDIEKSPLELEIVDPVAKRSS